MSKKKLTPFIFKLAAYLLLEFDNFHFSNDTMLFNAHRELDLRFRLINGSFICYALYTLRNLDECYQIFLTHPVDNEATHLIFYCSNCIRFQKSSTGLINYLK